MHISELNHFRSNKNIKFKEEIVDGEKFTIVSYMIADPELWKQPNAIECRGITFNESGECVSRPFHKFFNVGENEKTQIKNLNFADAVFEEKRDGSMITGVVLASGKVALKTKKSFYSSVAIDAQENMTDEVSNLIKQCAICDTTAIFEYTSPNNQVVIDYGNKPQFVLLAIRDNKTGKYHLNDFKSFIFSNTPIVYSEMTIQKALSEATSVRGIEGYVITLKDGFTKVKLKTDWYNSLHHVMTELRERDVAQAVLDETIDDMKASVVAHGKDKGVLEEIEKRVVSELICIQEKTDVLYQKIKECSSRKDAAIKYSKDVYFSAAMKLYDGLEPNYTKLWEKMFKENYTFKTVYNPAFSGDA